MNQTPERPAPSPSGRDNQMAAGLPMQGNPTKSNALEIPQISLPKGGGALKGIDEKFQVNAVNGTASFSIPLPLSPSRGGFQPSLSIGYNSGVGNSLFGIGWGVDFPAIQRRTDRKLPRYRDGDESDVFLFSGAEDLVPVLDAQQTVQVELVGDFEVRSYRPRIEGLFAKIERINRKKESVFYWKVTTKENVVTIFGRSGTNRIADPNNPNRIFKWLPELSYDDKGNCLIFFYKAEDTAQVHNQLHERNRLNGLAPFTNRYLKRVAYGNQTPYFPPYVANPDDQNAIYNPPTPQTTFLFEAVFDFGEHTDDTLTEKSLWKARTDAFSDYHAGFEIRTYRQCHRVLVFHRFTELGTVPLLVRSMGFTYKAPVSGTVQNAELSYLTQITQTGFAQNAPPKTLPPLTFEYQALNWNTKVKTISPENIANAPVGIGANYQWVDFFGEGISGILSEQADAWYYKSNLGNGSFSNAFPISPKPSWMGISNGSLSLQDVEANGKKYIVSQARGLQGYFEQTEENDWLPFRPFDQIANLDTTNPNVKFIDLNGDGIPDLVLSEETVFTWYPSTGTAGYDSPEVATKPFDEEKGPAIVFADSTQRIYLADMSGDGLTDIVQIENQRVCYWPNLGYGRFGAKVTLSNFQGFDHPDMFNPTYLHLTDVSGTGATDILYLGKTKFSAYLNLSGNALSKPIDIDPFWDVTQPSQLSVVDLLGTGTGCIVWSSPLPAYAGAPMQYMDLMGGVKPHIMVAQRNGMGKETTVTYKSSTEYYLADKKAGTPWATKLPFPVQCVSKMEVVDTVSDLRFTTQYTYHHGYYDHPEREFRGFGRVDQTDTEEYQYLKNKNAANATDVVFYEPPVLSKTWFHTGAFLKKERILDHFERDYWYNHPSLIGKNRTEYALPEAQLPPGLTTDELQEAHRACKGMTLRQEVFSLDGSNKEKLPYSVATHNCHIRVLQKKATNTHAVFLVQESEAITFSYERTIVDPRIAHTLNLELDDFGNVLKGVSVVYGREEVAAERTVGQLPTSLKHHRDFIKTAQTQEHFVYTETKVTTDAVEKIGAKPLVYHRLPMPWCVKTFEVAGFSKTTKPYQLADFQELVSGKNLIVKRYEEPLNPVLGTIQLRIIEQAETLFLRYDLENPLEAGTHGALGMGYESYQLAYTPELIDVLFNIDQLRVSENELVAAKYSHIDRDVTDKNWWIRSGRVLYIDKLKAETRTTAQNRFYVPIGFTDPFGSTTTVEYPANNTFLFVEKTIDALGNETRIMAFDYRVLAPRIMKDANDNLSEVSFDALGLVVGAALLGKGNQADDLVGFEPDLNPQRINDFFLDPFKAGADLLKNATTRTVYDFSSIPARVGTIVRETHVRQEDGTLNPDSKLQYSFEYTGGMGTSVLKKVRAEAGKAQKVANGVVIEVDANPRWVGNGRTIMNNKGKPVKQYEPYFSTTHLYENEPELREVGVTPILHYDSAGRNVLTHFPDGTLTRVEYDSWQQQSFDQNDTILESQWKAIRENPDAQFLQKLQAFEGDIAKEKEALAKTLIHANTPSTILTDSLGRPFYTIAHNKWEVTHAPDPTEVVEEFSATRVVLDIEGNARAVIDARDNTVMAYDYDMLGHTAHQTSMDAGERWLLNDCMGKPTWAWDSKNQRFETDYDRLHRPTTSKLFRNNQGSALLFEKIVFGTDKAKNENGVPIAHFDTAGVARIVEVDFKGSIKKSSRQVCRRSEEIPDWNDLSAEVFSSSVEYDALGRAVESTSPHDATNTRQKPSVYKPIYNEANLLDKVQVSVRQAPNRLFVGNIDYDAKGQRTKIVQGNNTVTLYEYDPDTFRLRRLQTNALPFVVNPDGVTGSYQDLFYTYDPVGNIINIEDKAQQRHYFRNEVAAPINTYRYDALYRLIEARGREHSGQNQASNAYDRSRMFSTPVPTDDNALRNYTQRYTYDAVGNMQTLQHRANGGSWTRNFQYANNSNRLLGTELGAGLIYELYVKTPTLAEKYPYDVHGNMTTMPHLPGMDWNFKDQLQHIQIQASTNNDQADGATYTYDSNGQRIRKIVTKGTLTEERLYLGGFEIFRKKQGNTLMVERESLHIMDDQNRIALVESLTVAPPNSDEPVTLTRYQFSNHLGTACLELTDEPAPRIISYEEYHTYGSTAYQNQNATIKAAAKRYRYTGMERDEESGLNYHTSRYYAPWLCRWTAADPIGIGDGVNVYAYCEGNVIKLTDLSGTAGGLPLNLDESFEELEKERQQAWDKTQDDEEDAEKEKFRQRRITEAHMRVQNVGDGEPGSSIAIGGGMLYNFLADDVKPNADDLAALARNGKAEHGPGGTKDLLKLQIVGPKAPVPTPTKDTPSSKSPIPTAIVKPPPVGVPASATAAPVSVTSAVPKTASGFYDSNGRYRKSNGRLATDPNKAVVAPTTVRKPTVQTQARPTPPESEQLAASGNVTPTNTQTSFRSGIPVPYGTEGSTRPDVLLPELSLSVEVKNYDLSKGNSGLVSNVVEQAIDRAKHLPGGFQQALVIDVRGQKISDAQLQKLFNDINTKSGNLFGNRWWVFMN